MKAIDKKFDAVKYMREQRDRLSQKLVNLPKEDILEYFRQKQFSVKPSN
ncbi:MAG: hypothetical protein KIT33_03100 [Candidatus Kapabacteria bacterium]|nr:hypothetical protein [Ignavibacteriota bacterium]MCW5883937.1 hypothetical protein [Candidatus Kapabacteria bacterium]